MAVASYILVTYIPDAPPSCGFFSHLSSWKILRHHPRFLAVFPTPTSTRPVRPSSSVDIDGVPGAPPTVRGDGTPPPSPSSASGGGRSTVAVELPGPMPTRSKRTKDQAGLLEASASMAKRVKELTDASSSKSETLKNMERSMFFNTSEMRNMQAAGDFQQRTAARMLTEMEEEDRKSAARHAQASVGWRREAEETLRLKAIADAEAESAARRAASRATRLVAKAAERAKAAARVCAAAAAGTEASAAADAAGNEEGEGGWEDGGGRGCFTEDMDDASRVGGEEASVADGTASFFGAGRSAVSGRTGTMRRGGAGCGGGLYAPPRAAGRPRAPAPTSSSFFSGGVGVAGVRRVAAA